MPSKTISLKRKRKSGIPTGNAGEYFAMGELLRRGYDAQLADRNTKGYDLLVGRPDDGKLRKVQVKSVRVGAWYVNLASFEGAFREQVTIYVILGKEDGLQPPRFFIARNSSLASKVSRQQDWEKSGFMTLKSVEKYENRWDIL
jgi:hypothetical protein